MSENDDKSKAAGSSDSQSAVSSGSGLGSKLKSLIKIVTPKPKQLGRSNTCTVSSDKVSVSTSEESLPAVSVLSAPPVGQAPPVEPAPRVEPSPELDGAPMHPATQSECDPSYLEQPDSTFLAHLQGPSPMVIVPDSPYIKKRKSRSAKAAEPPKPEAEWHGMLDEPSAQTSQQRVLEDMPSPDELRELTTGKHKILQEPPEEPPPPVQSKVSRMMPERTFSERVKIFFVELIVTIKKLFNPQP